MNRAHADHFAGRLGDRRDHAPSFELPRGGAGAQKLAGQIDADHGIPLLERHPVERRIPLQPGIADRDVQGSEMRDRIAEHLLDLVLLADVRLQRDRLAAHALDRVRDLFRGFGIDDIVDDDIRAGMSQSKGDGLADAGIGAGDERGLAGEDRLVWDARQSARVRQCGGRWVLGIGFFHGNRLRVALGSFSFARPRASRTSGL